MSRPGGRKAPRPVAQALAQSLDAATYAGYRVGFEAARDEAAALLLRLGHAELARRIEAMTPLPERRRGDA